MPKTSGTVAASNMAANDIFIIVTNPAGVAQTAHIPLHSLCANLNVNVVITGVNSLTAPAATVANLNITYTSTPLTTSTACVKGQIWFDSGYIYVATADNTVKRASLQSF